MMYGEVRDRNEYMPGYADGYERGLRMALDYMDEAISVGDVKPKKKELHAYIQRILYNLHDSDYLYRIPMGIEDEED